VKCTRCRTRAEVQLREHNAAFCRTCFVGYVRRQVERTISSYRMLAPGDRVLVAISGGKDSLALWDVLLDLGYDASGFYLAQGIGDYSTTSQAKAEAFARSRGRPLQVTHLEAEGGGIDVPTVARLTRRSACSACGTLKRHYFDRAALEGRYDALATGHNLDDEAARLLGNVLRWEADHLARQRPVLEPTHPRFVRKVKPLVLLSEYETASYAFLRGIDYVVDECPNAAGATQLVHKDALNRLEVASPGTKRRFVKEFLRSARGRFADASAATSPGDLPGSCRSCGMPAWGEVCSCCRLIDEVGRKRADPRGPSSRLASTSWG